METKHHVLDRFYDTYFWGYNFLQLSPCLKHALIQREYTARGDSIMRINQRRFLYYLCDLTTGKVNLFIENRFGEKNESSYIDQVYWCDAWLRK
jgi:hypothetical protein